MEFSIIFIITSILFINTKGNNYMFSNTVSSKILIASQNNEYILIKVNVIPT